MPTFLLHNVIQNDSTSGSLTLHEDSKRLNWKEGYKITLHTGLPFSKAEGYQTSYIQIF